MRTILIALCIFISTFSFAQTDTSRIQQYCEMVCEGKFLSNKISIDLDFGEGKNGWSFKNTSLRDETTGKVKKFKSIVDALNYMGASGWSLLNAYPVSEGGGMGGAKNVYHYVFVKSFSKNEMVQSTAE